MYKTLFGSLLGLAFALPISGVAFLVMLYYNIASPTLPYYDIAKNITFAVMIFAPVVGAAAGLFWGRRQTHSPLTKP